MSAMRFRRALLSAVTLFGGHFLNRRLDRIALIGALLVVAAFFSIPLVHALLTMREEGFYYVSKWVARLPLILVAAIALLSAGLTFRDARQPPRAPLTATIRITRLPLTIAGTLVLATAFGVAAMSPSAWSYLQLASTVPTA